MIENFELFDAEVAQILVEDLTVEQIRRLKRFYQFRTGDMDLTMLEEATKNL